jgi:DNA polymerase V
MKLTKIMDGKHTKFGENSILRRIFYTHSATARYRNTFIGVASRGAETEIFAFAQK